MFIGIQSNLKMSKICFLPVLCGCIFFRLSPCPEKQMVKYGMPRTEVKIRNWFGVVIPNSIDSDVVGEFSKLFY